MSVYRLNLRVFWPLVTGLCTALLCLFQVLSRSSSRAAEESAPWASGSLALLKCSALLLLLGYLLLRYCASPGGDGAGGAARRSPASGGEISSSRRRRRRLLEHFHEQQLRLSPHVLGHSKAHVSLIVGELVRAARAQPGPLALTLRGDFVQVGSAYEQHKIRSPDCFDILVPLRLPPRLELEPRCCLGSGPGPRFLGALKAPPRRSQARAGGEAELAGQSHLSAALVLRWFQGHLQRCLGAVRYRLQERCRISLSACPGLPLTLHILPRSDYVCCHLSMAVRLIPAIPLGDSLYLLALQPKPKPAASPSKLEAIWGLNVSKHEQRMLGWLKEQTPLNSCHLTCLQIIKGLRDLSSRGLQQPFCTHWRRVLSSYILKTALFSLMLRGPMQAWEEQFLVERLEDLVMFLRDCLQKRVLMHFFLGNASLPEAVTVPKFLKESTPFNLLSEFDAPTLDLVAFQLLNTWNQAPKIIRKYSNQKYWRRSSVLCKHISDSSRQELHSN
uniref:ITPRIP like 2 n=1 Tax=Sphenodon punctatus TaxID=8508 RepID=A0A8D0GHP0_SPHPU